MSAHEGYETITPHLAEHYAVLDHLGKERVDVQGGSMGSYVAIAFGLAHPERVDKLLLGAGAAPKCDGMGVSHFRVWQHLARAYGVASREAADERVNKAFLRKHIDCVGLDVLVEGMIDSASSNAETAVFIGACQVMIDADVREELRHLTTKTLVMEGAPGHADPARRGAGRCRRGQDAELIPSATLAIFEGSGHGHSIERANESMAVILDFLR